MLVEYSSQTPHLLNKVGRFLFFFSSLPEVEFYCGPDYFLQTTQIINGLGDCCKEGPRIPDTRPSFFPPLFEHLQHTWLGPDTSDAPCVPGSTFFSRF